jgi:hypothetical protein
MAHLTLMAHFESQAQPNDPRWAVEAVEVNLFLNSSFTGIRIDLVSSGYKDIRWTQYLSFPLPQRSNNF